MRKRMLSPSPTTDLTRRYPCKSTKKSHGDVPNSDTTPTRKQNDCFGSNHLKECRIFRKVLEEVSGEGCSTGCDNEDDKFVPISVPSNVKRNSEESAIDQTCCNDSDNKSKVFDQDCTKCEHDCQLTHATSSNCGTENPFTSCYLGSDTGEQQQPETCSKCGTENTFSSCYLGSDDEHHPAVTLHFNDLPILLKSQIFSYLTMNELLCTASLVCKTWYEAAREPGLWRRLHLDRPGMLDEDLWNVVGINANLSQLHVLDCRMLSGKGIAKALAGCPALKELIIMRCNQLKADAFCDIGEHCPLLAKINFSNTNGVPDAALEKIASHCSHLSELRLNRCSLISDESITQVARCCPKLKVLTFQENKKVTDASLQALCAFSHNIEVLSLHKCSITSQGIMHLHKLTKLRNLDLSNLSSLSSNSVGEAISNLPQLDTLNLCLSKNINDSCLHSIAASCKKLKYLFLVSCNITDEGLISIGRHSRSIEHLDIGWCEDITDRGATALSQMCSQLKYLGMVRCDQITEGCVARLVKEFPHIHYSTFLLDSQRLLEKAKRQGFQLNTV
ncbi:F-box/LRR-repeat protein 17-like [Amphiura filiformis]|uniref:F-box/LRR-repeat protein 17-like n=1 Tax=Amphiura filiformis TaxID=82378 RepID=UPI003B21D686